MKYEWLESYCLSKNAAVKDYKEEWQATRFIGMREKPRRSGRG